MSYDGPNPLPVPAGGTGDATLTAYAVLTGGTTSTAPVQSIASVGTSGQVLTSNGAGALPTFQAAAATGITTIDGDTGSATGSTVTFNANSNAGETVLFVASGSTVDLTVTDINNNTTIGLGSGKSGMSGGSNSCYGTFSGNALTTGNSNTFLGFVSGTHLATGQHNSTVGADTLNNFTGGSYNFAAGYGSGANYTSTESSNILINAAGTTGESNVIRIGTQGTGSSQQSTCFIAGIEGVSVSNLNYVTINTSTGQLGSTSATSGIVTLDGDSGSATGSTVTISGGSTGLTTTASSATMDLVGTLNVGHGGTGDTSFTAYMPIAGGTTTTGALQSVTTGTAGYALTYVSSSALPTWQAVFSSINRHVLTSSGTYTPTSGMVYCDIEVIGAGGGSGGCAAVVSNQVAGAGGGGGGGYARGIFSAASVGASQAFLIGAAGAAGVAGNNTGGTGGTSSVAGLSISATGGVGGSGSASSTASLNLGGAGGAGSGGDFQTTGTPGGSGFGFVIATIPLLHGGIGGSTFFGGGGNETTSSSSTVGTAGTSPGGGGGGSNNFSSASGVAGGAGFRDEIIITEYIT